MLLLVVSLTSVALVASGRPTALPANASLAETAAVTTMFAARTGFADNVHVHAISSPIVQQINPNVENNELNTLDGPPRGIIITRAPTEGEQITPPAGGTGAAGYGSVAAFVGVAGAGGIIAYYLRRRRRRNRANLWELLPSAEEGHVNHTQVQVQDPEVYTLESTEAFARAHPGSIDLHTFGKRGKLVDVISENSEEDVTSYAQHLPRPTLLQTKVLTSPSPSVPDYPPSRVIPVMTRTSALDLIHSQETSLHSEETQLIHLEDDLIHFEPPPQGLLSPGVSIGPVQSHHPSWATDIDQPSWDAEDEVRAWVLDQTSVRSPGSHHLSIASNSPSTPLSIQRTPSSHLEADWPSADVVESPREVPIVRIQPPEIPASSTSRQASPVQEDGILEEVMQPLVLLQVDSPHVEQPNFISPILPELKLKDSWGGHDRLEARWAEDLKPVDIGVEEDEDQLEEGDTLVAGPEENDESPLMGCDIALPASDIENEPLEDLLESSPVEAIVIDSPPLVGQNVPLPPSEDEDEESEDDSSSESGTDIVFTTDDEDYMDAAGYDDYSESGFRDSPLPPLSLVVPTVVLSPPPSLRSNSSRSSARPRIRDVFAQSPDTPNSPSCRPAWSLRASDAPSLSVTHAPSLSAISRAPSFNNLARAAAGLSSRKQQTPSPSVGSLTPSGSPRVTPFSTPLSTVTELPSSPSKPPAKDASITTEEGEEVAIRRRAFRSPLGDMDLMPLDLALAMQLRPGMGAGADSAFLVRFLMAMFGWFAVLVAGARPGGRKPQQQTLDAPEATTPRGLRSTGSSPRAQVLDALPDID